MRSWTYPVGVTARTPGPDGPLRHARTSMPSSRYGRNVRAVCGTSILPWDRWGVTGDFDPDHPRACAECRQIVKD